MMPAQSTDRLLVFVRNPRLGKVKTRLAATVGDAEALRIYLRLLYHTQEVAQAIHVERFVYYSDELELGDAFHASLFHKRVQHGRDLGARMMQAFSDAFKDGATRVCIIGSDCAALGTDHLIAAFEALDSHDVVMGPAEDGGYYLLGMKKLHADMFHHKDWGTDSVAGATLADAERLGLSVMKLPVLPDIDTEEDWNKSPLA